MKASFAKPRTPIALLTFGALVLIIFPTVACRRITRPSGWAAPVVAEDVVFATTHPGQLSAIKAEDFARLWRFPDSRQDGTPLEAIYGAPVVTASAVYFGGYNGRVYALDRQSGRPIWNQAFETGPVIGGLVLDENTHTLFVMSDDSRVYGLDPETGKLKAPWPFKTGDGIWATPLLAGGILYVPSLDGKLYALDAGTSQIRWQFDAGAGLISTPAISGTSIIVGGIGRRLYAIDANTGSALWSFKADNWFWAEPIVAEGIVYAASLDHHLYALDLATGAQRWSFEADGAIRSRPLLVEDMHILVVADRAGQVYGLNPDSADILWRTPQGLGASVLSDLVLTEKGVLISTLGGQLFELDPSNGSFSRVTLTRE